MFSTVIYFLTALIIYATSDLVDITDPGPGMTAGWLESLFLALGFFLICRLSFLRIGTAIDRPGTMSSDQAISTAINRLSILALAVFAVNIYGYRLDTLFAHVRLFQIIPTLEALLFLGLFVLYLAMIWHAAYPVQKSFSPVR